MTTPPATPDPQVPRSRTPVDREADLTAAEATGAPVWSDTLGRAGARSAQVLLVAAVLVGVVWLLLRVALVVVSVLVALILASAAYPLVRWLVGRGWSRFLATGAVFLGIVVVLGSVVTGIVFAVRSEWDTLAAAAVTGWGDLQRFVASGPLPLETGALDDALQRGTEFLGSGAFIGGALSGISAATEFITGVFLMVVILFFFLKDGPTLWNFTLRWFRGRTRARLAESGERAVRVLGGYVRGTAVIALLDAVSLGVPLAIMGVPLALPLAVIAFIGGFLPIVGALAVGILAALVALVTNGLLVALIVIAIVVTVSQLEGDVLQPLVMGRALSLHALVVLLALTVGTLVGGLFGAILAVPLTAVAWSVIQVWSDRYQSGEDPVLGADPLEPAPRTRPTLAERWARLRRRRPRHP